MKIELSSIEKDIYFINKYKYLESKYLSLEEYLNQYYILNKIGIGGFSTIYKVKDKKNGNIVALKYIKKKDYNYDYNNEVKIMQKLKNKDYICQIIDFYEDEDVLLITMEYLNGVDLLTYIEKYKYNKDLILYIFLKIILGLQNIHNNNIIHRDLKPENIIVYNINNNIDIKIIDFGLAVEYSPNLNIRCGTIEYLAPEIIKSENYDYKVDLYSLGLILFIMLKKYHPFYKSQNSDNNLLINKLLNDKDDDINILIKNLICHHSKRFGIKDILKHYNKISKKKLKKSKVKNIISKRKN